jgi:hypothetical protein
VDRAWVQVKQDETDEVAAGTVFNPSDIAPVAPGHRDGRLGAFIERLAARGIEPRAWMPVLHDAQAAAAHDPAVQRLDFIRYDGDTTVRPEQAPASATPRARS